MIIEVSKAHPWPNTTAEKSAPPARGLPERALVAQVRFEPRRRARQLLHARHALALRRLGLEKHGERFSMTRRSTKVFSKKAKGA